jgi:plastocyanin
VKNIHALLAAMAVIAAVVTACGGSGSSDGPAATAGEQSSSAVAGPTLTIASMAFGQPLTVAPGTRIDIVNNDTVEHAVTSKTEGAFDVHVDGGKRKTLTAPAAPGQYLFDCVYHPSMTGTLTVR